jgi:multidrug efflux system membrane fusion protein
VLTDQDRRYVYIVGKDNAAERRDVTLGPHIESLRVIVSGLAAGDRVIVNGMRKIFFAGQKVNPRDVPMDDPNRPAPQAPVAPAG